MTAGLLKPEIASSGETKSNSSNRPRQQSAMTSIGIHSRTNAVMVKAMIPSSRIVSRSIGIDSRLSAFCDGPSRQARTGANQSGKRPLGA